MCFGLVLRPCWVLRGLHKRALSLWALVQDAGWLAAHLSMVWWWQFESSINSSYRYIQLGAAAGCLASPRSMQRHPAAPPPSTLPDPFRALGPPTQQCSPVRDGCDCTWDSLSIHINLGTESERAGGAFAGALATSLPAAASLRHPHESRGRLLLWSACASQTPGDCVHHLKHPY